MLDMLFLLAILGMLITRKQYTTQEVEKRSKKGTKRVGPIVPLFRTVAAGEACGGAGGGGEDSGGENRE